MSQYPCGGCTQVFGSASQLTRHRRDYHGKREAPDQPCVMEVMIYLKSGQSFTIDATKMTTKRDAATNQLIGIEWNTPPDTDEHRYRSLSYLRIDDVSAIVSL